MENLNFSQALEQVKMGFKIARAGWNGKGMFAFFVAGSTFEVNRAPLDKMFALGTQVNYRAHLDLKAVDGTIGVWIPSMTDILAADWCVIAENAGVASTSTTSTGTGEVMGATAA